MKSYWKEWFKAAGIRAIKTFSQALVAEFGGGAVGLFEVDWARSLSVAAMAALISILTSLAGIPEVPKIEEG